MLVTNTLPYQTPGISNQALFFMKDVKIFAERADMFFFFFFFFLGGGGTFLTTPLWENGSVREFVYLETFWRTKFLQSGIVFMGVQALHMTFSSTSRTDKMLTLTWTHSQSSCTRVCGCKDCCAWLWLWTSSSPSIFSWFCNMIIFDSTTWKQTTPLSWLGSSIGPIMRWVWSVRKLRVTDGHFQNVQLWMPIKKKKWSDVTDWFFLYMKGITKCSWNH